VLTTHFHLLVRSPRGELSEAFRRAQNEYSRFFNRKHKRDGTLVRGRFFSKRVTSLAYRHTLVRYIDNNAVHAGLVSEPWTYRWCSAAQYVHAGGPAWLERSWVERAVSPNRDRFRGEDYIRTFGGQFEEATRRLVESRISSTRFAQDELDDLVGAAPPRVRAWMQRKAKLADGKRVGLSVCDRTSIQKAVQRARDEGGPWKVMPSGLERCAYDLIEAGLLRTLSCLTWEQISLAIGSALSSSQRRYRLHHRLLEEDPIYAQRASEIGAAALAACHPTRVSG